MLHRIDMIFLMLCVYEPLYIFMKNVCNVISHTIMLMKISTIIENLLLIEICLKMYI